jgi:hypothetical protein
MNKVKKLNVINDRNTKSASLIKRSSRVAENRKTIASSEYVLHSFVISY